MSPETLLAWLDGTLPEEERRAVARWVVTADDPRLPAVLRGLTRARDERISDGEMLQRAPDATWLVDAWRRLLAIGRAEVSVGEGATAIPAFAGVERPHMPMVLEEDGDALRLFDVGGDRDVAVAWTMDAAAVAWLSMVRDEDGTRRGVLPRPKEGRVTFWRIVPAAASGEPSDVLRRAVSDPMRTVWALRYDPRW